MTTTKKYRPTNNRKPTKGRKSLQRIPIYVNNKTGNLVTSKEFKECKDKSIILAGYRTIVHNVAKADFGRY